MPKPMMPCHHPRRRSRAWTTAAVILAFLLLGISLDRADADSSQPHVSIQGSTTFNEQILRRNLPRIEARSGVKLEVLANKSIWGLLAVLEKRADIAMLSADLEPQVAASRITAPDLPYDRLSAFVIDRTQVAFVVNTSNPVRRLAGNDIKRILMGEVLNWRELGGPDRQIRVVATQNGGGTVTAVRTQLLDSGPIQAPNAIRLESARHVLKAVEQEPGAFGVTQFGLAAKSPNAIVESPLIVEQKLILVTLGEPTIKARAVIEAIQAAASEQNLAERE